MAHNIILNDGDDITEASIRKLLGRVASSGYVEDGLDLAYHGGDGTVDVSAGVVHILENGQDITIETDAFVGHQLAAGDANTLWVVVDPSMQTDDEAVSLASNTTGVAPSDPSIEIAVVDTGAAEGGIVSPSSRGSAPALDGTDINPRSIGAETPATSVRTQRVDLAGTDFQSALDGRIVPVAPGIGALDAIDPHTTGTPVQDAIDAIKAVGETGVGYGGATGGAGTILYPSGRIPTPGGITNAGGIVHKGTGMPTTEIQLTDPTADLFSIAGKKDAAYSYWDQLTFFGGSGGTRSSGSAFHVTGDGGGIPSFNFGIVGFHMWGSAPVIHFDGADCYSSTWGHVFSKGNGHEREFFRAHDCTVYALTIAGLHPAPFGPTAYAIDFDDAEIGGHIGVINSGSGAGRVLRHNGSGRSEGLTVDWINTEPNSGNETPIDHAVSLGGLATTVIHHLTLTPRLPVDDVILLSDGPLGNGHANKRIGNVRAGGRDNHNLTNSYIRQTTEPQEQSWYWGPSSDIDAGGYSEGVIALGDLQPSAGGGGV